MRLSGLLATLLVTAACATQDTTRYYDLKGQVLAVDPKLPTVLVKHEDIVGFMPAMTMPYEVKDLALIKNLAPGDLITAKLAVGAQGSAWLSSITKTGSGPLPADAPEHVPVAANVKILEPGDETPDTSLIAEDGNPISLKDWRGSAVALTFIYISCPLPQFCPLLDRRFAELQDAIAKDASLRGKVRLLSVSFDPARDTAEQLKAHAATLKADPQVWRFATAPADIVDRFAVGFGVNVIREKDATITHNLRTAVIDPSGRVVAIHSDNTWTVNELVSELKRALGH